MKNPESLSKNKGEWAELYVLYSLLGAGVLHISDPESKSVGHDVKILTITRENRPGVLTTYAIKNGAVILSEDGVSIQKISQFDFLLNAEKVKEEIFKKKGASFALSERACAFMKALRLSSPKARSLKVDDRGLPVGGKNDILITYQNPNTGAPSTTGFSIKTSFQHPSTLQNGTKLTNFGYQIEGLNDKQIKEINSCCQKRVRKNGEPTADVFARCDKIINYNAKVIPVIFDAARSPNPIFSRNLMMIDISLPTTISDIVYLHYFSPDHPTFLSEMPALLAQKRPIQEESFDTSYYERKIKDYLFACFAGLVPGTPWKGKTDLEGGYLMIKADFTIYGCLSTETETFKDYLFNNTKLDHSDCSSNRSDYGIIFLGLDGKHYLNLNLQVRFCRPDEKPIA